MYEVVSKDELYHYGVKGMKWHFHKPPNETTIGIHKRYISADEEYKNKIKELADKHDKENEIFISYWQAQYNIAKSDEAKEEVLIEK